MKKNNWKSYLLILLGLMLLVGAAARLNALKKMRRDYNFDPSDPNTDRQTAAQLKIPTVALFTFRSLAIDYLWIRADTLKLEGQYFDAIQLARLICALQPNLPSVWDFQSWNMAYNISVAMPNPPERWHWIEAGIKLLRDEGLAALPRSPELHHSLGYIFGDKMGRPIDEFHRYYKQRLAFEMMDILGPGIVSNQRLAQMAATPSSWRDVIADPNIAELTQRIIDAEPRFRNDRDMLKGLIQVSIDPTAYAPELHQIIENHKNDYTWKRLDLFARTDQLRSVWKMKPEIMLEINHKYGPVDAENPDERLPLDWRLPYCHAIYWAELGLKHTTEVRYRNVGGNTWMDLKRLLYHNLQHTFHYGRIQILNPNRPDLITGGMDALEEHPDKKDRLEVEVYNGQDVRMFPVAFQAMMDVIDERAAVGDEAPVGVESASVYLARNLIVNVYLAGHEKLAGSAYLQLQERYPYLPDYQMTLQEFVAGRLEEEFVSLVPRTAGQIIYSMLEKAFIHYATRNDDVAAVEESRARQIHVYMETEKLAGEKIDRRLLPEYPQMLAQSIGNVLQNPMVTPTVKSLLLYRLQRERPEDYELLKQHQIIR